MKLRVLTYNLHGGRGVDGRRDYGRIGRFLKDYRIDIALIQEMDTRQAPGDDRREPDRLQSDHFGYFVSAPTLSSADGWYGNALLSRFPVTQKNIIDISESGREPRNILEVFLETPQGSLHVVTTHKGLHLPERRRQIKKLHAALVHKSKIPLIVGGDINVWHLSASTLSELNQSLHPLPAGATFPTRFPILHLDRMWCRPANLAQTVCVLKTPETRIYSDHYPLMAEIILEDPP